MSRLQGAAARAGTGRGGRHGRDGWRDHRDRIHGVLDAFSRASSVVITTHVNADGDGAGSAVALAAFLRQRGVQAWIAFSTPFPENLRFLLPESRWVVDGAGEEAFHRCRKADLAILVDTSEWGRVGNVRRAMKELPVVVIDHHPRTPRSVDGVVFRDTGACAAGLLVQELIEETGEPLTSVMAEALYVAIMSDTGGFRFENVDADCLRAAARLVERGARPAELFRYVWGQFRPRRMELLRESLGTLRIQPGGRVAWMVVPKDAYDRLGATLDDLEGFVDVPRDIVGVQVAILFRTTADGRIKVSMRSVAPTDVRSVAAEIGGGGHERAAAAVISGPLDQAITRVVRQVERRLEENDGEGRRGPAGRPALR